MDLDNLRRLAASATPGPWVGPIISDKWPPGWIAVCEGYTDAPQEHVPGAYFVTTGHILTARADNGIPEPSPTLARDEANASYIAAASPDVILALLDRLEKPEVTDAMVDAAVRAMRTSDISPHNVYGWMRAAIVAALGAR